MAPALGQPCPDIPGLHRYCPRKGQAAGCVSDIPGRISDVSPTRAFPLGLGLIEAYLEWWWAEVSSHCQGLEVIGLWQSKEGGNWADAEAFAHPAVSAQQGKKGAHCASRSSLPLPTEAVLLGEPRSFLKDSSSPKLSEGAGGRNRRVHVVLPWPGCVGPLVGTNTQG